jgi:aldehyde:ferredoxin oxidoreductase
MVDRRINGTAGLLTSLNALGILPTKNFNQGEFDEATKISSEMMNASILVGRKACFACPVGCGRKVKVTDGPFAPVNEEMGGPEYETLAAFGSLLLNDDIKSIAKANEFCNLQGIDTVSAGVVLAYAMECYEQGILPKQGLDLTWGNANAMLTLLQQISSREGLGDILAEGVKRASEKIGKGSAGFAMHVKGLELPLHEGRGKKGVGFLFAVGNAGSKHLEAEHDTVFSRPNIAPEIGITDPVDRFSLTHQMNRIVKTQNLWALVDSLILCKFVAPVRAMTLTEMVEMTNQATGGSFTIDEMLLVGERAINIGRAFNAREGFTKKDDKLPPRLFQPLEKGPSAGHYFTMEEFASGVHEFYILRGWDPVNGLPTKETLLKLGLKCVASDMESRSLLS